jgi:hypothetical protein
MIRKQTWILLAIFIILLGAAFYLRKNPLPEKSEVTPSPTAQARLLEGWQSSDIVWLSVTKGNNPAVQAAQDASGRWMLNEEQPTVVEPGKIEAVQAEIAEALIQASLPANYDLAAVGLDVPTAVISIRNAAGKEVHIQVGTSTPTGTGYYLQVDQQAPVVVSKGAVDSILDQMTMENLAPVEQQPAQAP